MRNVHVHLVSDSTGETVSNTARACLVQFKRIRVQEHPWFLVRTKGQVQRVMEAVEGKPGFVLFTLVDEELRSALEGGCRRLGVPCVSVLDQVMAALSTYLGPRSSATPGAQHALDDEYYRRIDAMNFTLAHDDGNQVATLDEADVILVGVSRTSKTPTCMYLANRGIKAANVPVVSGMPLPKELVKAAPPRVVGLTRDPLMLVQIRRNRLIALGEEAGGDYIDHEAVREEVMEARRSFQKHGWPVIDVTRRSIEETAAAVLQLLAQERERGE